MALHTSTVMFGRGVVPASSAGPSGTLQPLRRPRATSLEGDALESPDRVADSLQLGAQFVLSHLTPLDIGGSPPKETHHNLRSRSTRTLLESIPKSKASTIEPITSHNPVPMLSEADEVSAARALAALPHDVTAAAAPRSVLPMATNNLKPRLSFATMIACAILDSPQQHLAVSDVYNYMKEKFPYFSTPAAGTGWKNSVRHNLSINKNFMKLPHSRQDEEDPGNKGSLWTIRPEHRSTVIKSIERQLQVNRRSAPQGESSTAGSRRASSFSRVIGDSSAVDAASSHRPKPPSSKRRTMVRQLSTDTLAGAATLLSMTHGREAMDDAATTPNRPGTVRVINFNHLQTVVNKRAAASASRTFVGTLPHKFNRHDGTRLSSTQRRPADIERQDIHPDWTLRGRSTLQPLSMSDAAESSVASSIDSEPTSPSIADVPRKRTNSGSHVFTFSAPMSSQRVSSSEETHVDQIKLAQPRSPIHSTPETKAPEAQSPPHARRRLEDLQQGTPFAGSTDGGDDEGDDDDESFMDTTDDLVAGAALLSLACS